MSDNEKLTHSSDENNMENTAAKSEVKAEKIPDLSIDSILAEYAAQSKTPGTPPPVKSSASLKDILDGDTQLKALYDEMGGEKETPETIVEEAQEQAETEKTPASTSDETVVFGVTGDIDIPESKSVKELFDTIETLTRINTGEIPVTPAEQDYPESAGTASDIDDEDAIDFENVPDVVAPEETVAEEIDAQESAPEQAEQVEAVETAETVEEAVNQVDEEDDDDDDDILIFGNHAADNSDNGESDSEEIAVAGEPLPGDTEADEPVVDTQAVFGEEQDPLFAQQENEPTQDVGFDEFEDESGETGSTGVVPEADAFDSVKNSDGEFDDEGEQSATDGKLKTLFGGTTDSTPVIGKNGKPTAKKKSKRSGSEPHRSDEVDFSSEQGINRSLNNLFKKSRFALLSVLGTGLFLLVSLFYTISSQFFPVSDYFTAGAYSTVYILIDLQIMFFAAMCALDKLIRGAVDLYDGFGSPECVSLVTTVLITAYSIFGAVYAGGRDEVYIFGTIGCLGLFLVSLYDYYKSTCDYQAFRIAASPTSKYGSVELDPKGSDCAPFESHLTAGSKAFTIQKGEKYLNFSRRNEAVPKCESGFGINCVVSIVLALLVGVATYILSELDFYVAATAAIVVYCSSIPFGTFIVSSLPRYILSKKASKHNCAIIGQNVHEEYENVSVISFEDTEVFNPKDVRVSSIRTYGNTALDGAIMDIAFISKKLGGPLSQVFSKAVTYNQSDIDGVEILEVYPDAIKAAIGSNEYILATGAFLRANGLACYEDAVDNSYISSLGSILYMVKNNETTAKFYIKYSINPQFENILASLNDSEICVSVRTVDPCINNDLLLSNLRNKDYLISVVKGNGIGSIPSTSKNVDSGIISITGIHNFLKTYILCDRLGRTVKVNGIVKAMGTAFGFIIPIALFALNFANPAGTVHVVNSLFVLLMQCFWILPIAIISRLYK